MTLIQPWLKLSLSYGFAACAELARTDERFALADSNKLHLHEQSIDAGWTVFIDGAMSSDFDSSVIAATAAVVAALVQAIATIVAAVLIKTNRDD